MVSGVSCPQTESYPARLGRVPRAFGPGHRGVPDHPDHLHRHRPRRPVGDRQSTAAVVTITGEVVSEASRTDGSIFGGLAATLLVMPTVSLTHALHVDLGDDVVPRHVDGSCRVTYTFRSLTSGQVARLVVGQDVG